MKQKNTLKKYQIGIILILINSLLWGISPEIIKVALIIIPPFAFLFYRFVWVTIFKIWEIFTNKGNLNGVSTVFKSPQLLVSAFLFNALTLAFYFKGLAMVTPLQAGVLAGTSPLFVIIPLVLLKKEKLTRKEILGIIIMIIGYAFLLINGHGFNNEVINWQGVLYIIIGNAVNALAIIINKKYLDEQNRVAYEFISSFMALIFFAVLLVFLLPQFLGLNWLIRGLFNCSVLYMAVFGTLIALTFFNKSMLYLEASETISFVYTQPFFLALLDLFLKIKHFNLTFGIGIFLLLFGIIFNILGIIREHEKHEKDSKYKRYNNTA